MTSVVVRSVVGSLVACLLVLAWLYSEKPSAGVPEGQLIERVQRLQSVNLDPFKAPDEAWVEQTLPDDWRQGEQQHTSTWYRLRFSSAAIAGKSLAIVLEKVNLNAEVFLNGTSLGSYGRMKEPLAHNWSAPLLFRLPEAGIVYGENVLHIEVRSFPAGHGLLGLLQLGDWQALSAYVAARKFTVVELPRVASGISLVLTLAVFAAWAMGRWGALNGWFFVTLLAWSIHSLKYHVTAVPVSSQFWAAVLFLSSISASYGFCMFLLRFGGLSYRWWERVLLGCWALSAGTILYLLAAQDLRMYGVGELSYIVTFLFGVSSLVIVAVNGVQHDSVELNVLGAVLTANVLFILHDQLQISGYINRSTGQLVVYAIPLLLASIVFLGMRRFVAALANQKLVLADVTAQAEVAVRRVVDLERESALAKERERIMRDMHDGVGGHLISSLALLEQRETEPGLIRGVLQQALTDLRLMIDSFDLPAQDLGLLFGALRERSDPVLKGTGFDVHWELEPLPDVERLTPHDALQILRILQEAITNAVRHSNAHRLTIGARFEEALGQIRLVVQDDGDGLVQDGSLGGRGMLNMRRRASDVKGHLIFDSPNNEDGTGTTVVLVVPLLVGEHELMPQTLS